MKKKKSFGFWFFRNFFLVFVPAMILLRYFSHDSEDPWFSVQAIRETLSGYHIVIMMAFLILVSLLAQIETLQQEVEDLKHKVNSVLSQIEGPS